MNLQEYKQKLLSTNPEFKKECERFDLWFELGQLWLKFRSRLNKFKSKTT